MDTESSVTGTVIASSLHNHAASESERCRRVGHRYEREREYESERAAVRKREKKAAREKEREGFARGAALEAQNRR